MRSSKSLVFIYLILSFANRSFADSSCNLQRLGVFFDQQASESDADSDQNNSPHGRSSNPSIPQRAIGPGSSNLHFPSNASPRAAEYDSLNNRIKFAQVLNPISGLSDRFKLQLLMQATLWSDANTDGGNDFVRVPWPPDSSDAKVVKVPKIEFRSKLRELLGPEKYESISKSAPPSLFLAVDAQSAGQFDDPDPAMVAHMNELFNWTQTRLVELARSFGANGPALDSMIQKIQSIQLVKRSDKEAWQKNCQSASGVRGEGESIAICSSQNDLFTVMDLARLMASAMDPCGSQFDIFDVDVEKLKALMSKVRRAPAFGNPYPVGMSLIASELEKEAARSGQLSGVSFYENGADGDGIQKKLLDEGVIRVRRKGIPSDQYPMNSGLKCALNSTSRLRRPSVEDQRNLARQVVQRRRDERGSKYNPQIDQQRILAAFKSHPSCGFGSEGVLPDDTREAFMSWAMTRLLGDAIKTYPGKRDGGEMVKMLTGYTEPRARQEPETVSQVIQMAVLDGTVSKAKGMRSRQLFEDFYSQSPAIRELVGCPALTPNACYSVSPSADSSIHREGTK